MMKQIVALIFLSIASAKPNINPGIHRWSKNNVFTIDDRLVEFDGETPDIPLITFDGDPTTTFEFRQTNDPVMVRLVKIINTNNVKSFYP